MSRPLPEPADRSSRFVIEERVGGGAMGEVYRALDRERGTRVAMKVLRDPEPDKVYRFKREFRALADVVHPNLVRLHELVSEGDRWFFTMELVDGVDLLTYIRGDDSPPPPPIDDENGERTETVAPMAATDGDGGDGWPTMTVEVSSSAAEQTASAKPRPSLPALIVRKSAPLIGPDAWQRLRDAARQLAVGIQALHDHGTLHRDLKPSNVMVTRDGRVVILDFGIVTELSRPSAQLSGRPFGTPAYMAPEVGLRAEIGEAADWYALGVMLYEAMAGRRPFHAPIAELIEIKRRADPPPVRELAIAPPADLEALCTELLARDPAKRPSGPEILARLGARADARAQTTRLVGREPHLATLRGAYREVLAGAPRVVMVTGSSGAGKSALVGHFLAEVGERGQALVVSGRCYERESVPFKAVDDLVDDLCEQLTRLATPEVVGLLPRHIGALVRLFPGLEQIDAVRAAPRLVAEPQDPHELRRAAFAALRELLVRLSARRPLVLHIDDGQWGDDDSAALLAEVFRAPLAPPALLIVNYRATDDMGRFVEHVRAIDPAQVELFVGDLAADDARRLADQLLAASDGPRRLADLIARESAGNALFVTELVRYVTSGADAERTVTLDDIVRARVGALTADARRLIEVLAVAAWPVPKAIALAAAGVDDDVRVIATLLAARLLHVRTGRAGDALETIHDRVRAGVVGGLDRAAVVDIHRRLAGALADRGDHLIDHLAEHLDLAGDTTAAGAAYQRAGDAAAAVLAFERAGRLYTRAIALLAPTGDRRATLHARLAEAWQNAGQGAAAAAAYLVAAEGIERAQSLRYRGQAAQQLLRAGHVDEGVTALSDVLGAVGMAMPRSRWRAIVSLLGLRARIRLGRLRFVERRADEVSLEQLTKLEIWWTAAVAIGMTDVVAGGLFQARHLHEALRAGDTHHVIHALSIESGYRSLDGVGARAAVDDIAVRARDLADRVGDTMDIAWAHGCHAFARYQVGEYRIARDDADLSLAILEGKAGVWFERATAEMYRLWALYWLGDFRGIVERVTALRAQALDLGDLYSATNLSIGLPSLAWLVRDMPDEGRRIADEAIQRWPHRSYHIQHYWHASSLAHIELYQGDPLSAWHRMRQAWKDIGGALLRRVQMVRIEVLWTRARAAIATAALPAQAGASAQKAGASAQKAGASVAQGPIPSRRALRRDAARAARALRREGRPDAVALALVIDAAVRNQRDDRDGALAQLSAAIDRAAASDLGALVACARVMRGRLIGGDRGATLVRIAQADLAAQGVADPAALARLFAPGF